MFNLNINKQKALTVISIILVLAISFVAIHTQITKQKHPDWAVLISEEGVVFEGGQQPFKEMYVDKKNDIYIFTANEEDDSIIKAAKEAAAAREAAGEITEN